MYNLFCNLIIACLTWLVAGQIINADSNYQTVILVITAVILWSWSMYIYTKNYARWSYQNRLHRSPGLIAKLSLSMVVIIILLKMHVEKTNGLDGIDLLLGLLYSGILIYNSALSVVKVENQNELVLPR
jgi:hypothetical protein